MARSTGCDKAIVNAAEEPMWYNHGPDAMEKTGVSINAVYS